MASTTVRVSAETHEVLRKLAAATGEPLQRVLEQAVENYRREQFFAEFNAAFDRLRSDPVAWEEYLAPDQPGTGGPRRRGALHQPPVGHPDPCRGPPTARRVGRGRFAMCEQVRSLAAERLGRRPFGSVPAAAMRSVEDSLRLLLRL